MKRYPQVVRAVTHSPWAVLPETMATIREVLALHVAGEQLSREDIDARIGNGPGSRGVYMAGSIAVLPLSGVIIPRATLFSDISGGTSVQAFRNSFLEAVGDDEVSAIVLDVNSPGGMVDLVPELAGDIRAARGEKPIVAVANTLMASAAYWLGSQADELYVTPSGDAGSIGVIAAHEDISRKQASDGVKTTLITAGKFKGEGNPFEPLNDEAHAAIQRRVDEAYDLFVTDIASGRDVPESTVREGMGEGRLLKAKAAQKAGLVDGIQTFEATVKSLTKSGHRPAVIGESATTEAAASRDASASAIDITITGTLPADAFPPSFVDEARHAHDAIASLVTRMRALREVREGRLTAAKRASLEALDTELVSYRVALHEALEASTPEPPALAGEGLELEAAFAGHGARLRLPANAGRE